MVRRQQPDTEVGHCKKANSLAEVDNLVTAWEEDNFLPPTSQMITARDDRQRNNKKGVNLITQRISVFSKVNKVFSGLCHRYHNIEENIFE